MQRWQAGLVAVAVMVLMALGVIGIASNVASAAAERHPRIQAAIRELKEARAELKEADHDFGGHRVKAIEAVDHAIEQLERALKVDK